MQTTNMWTEKEFADSEKVMQFKVGAKVTDSSNNGPLPQRFALDIKFPADTVATVRNFSMVSHMDMMWGINSYHMDDPMKRVLMRPPLGTIEKFRFKSSGMGSGMGGMMGGSKSGSGTGGKTG